MKCYNCIGGAGTTITIRCAESYAYPPKSGTVSNLSVKGDRTDSVNGKLYGFEDHYLVGGYGTAQEEESYEPFWFRTFRFVGLTVETADEPVVLMDVSYLRISGLLYGSGQPVTAHLLPHTGRRAIRWR